MATEKYLRPGEVGEMLGVSGQTATRWAKEGWIKHSETDGGQVRFRKSDVESYLQNPLLTTTEAGEILGVSSQTVASWGKSGKMVCHMLGRDARFRRSDVDNMKNRLEAKEAKKRADEELKELRRKRRELNPTQRKLRDQMRRSMTSRIESCRSGVDRFVDSFDHEELEEILPNRKLRWVIFLYDHVLCEEAVVSPRELTVDHEARTISFRERDERRFRTVYFDRVYGVK